MSLLQRGEWPLAAVLSGANFSPVWSVRHTFLMCGVSPTLTAVDYFLNMWCGEVLHTSLGKVILCNGFFSTVAWLASGQAGTSFDWHAAVPICLPRAAHCYLQPVTYVHSKGLGAPRYTQANGLCSVCDTQRSASIGYLTRLRKFISHTFSYQLSSSRRVYIGGQFLWADLLHTGWHQKKH